MGDTSDSGFRIKTMIILFIFVTLLYTSYGVFGSIEAPRYAEGNYANYNYNNSQQLDNYTGTDSFDYDPSEGQGFIDFIGNIGSFLTFGNIDNVFARMLINIVNVICFTVLGFLIYLFVRDWVPFV